MEKVEITNMCMIEDHINNKVLVMNKTKGDWTGIVFPGGHVEPGEAIVASTIREVKEETGLDINNLKLIGIKNWYMNSEKRDRYLVFLFKTSTFSGEIVNQSDEGTVFWVQRDSLNSLNFANGFKFNLEVMLDDDKTEYFIARDVDSNKWIEQII